MIKQIIYFFDKFEDRVRGKLSRYPILYTLIGAIAIVLFWRGVWITTDQIFSLLPQDILWLDGIISTGASIMILLATGLFVSFFINDQIILSGMKREKKLTEKTEHEVRQEKEMLGEVLGKLTKIEKEISTLHQHNYPNL